MPLLTETMTKGTSSVVLQQMAVSAAAEADMWGSRGLPMDGAGFPEQSRRDDQLDVDPGGGCRMRLNLLERDQALGGEMPGGV
jgi:hypothetical protein